MRFVQGACARPALQRIMWLDRQLAANTFPNCTTAARALEVSPKTIQRDIDFMRDRLERPIDYDDKRLGFYYYEAPEKKLPFPSPETLAYAALREQGRMPLAEEDQTRGLAIQLELF